MCIKHCCRKQGKYCLRYATLAFFLFIVLTTTGLLFSLLYLTYSNQDSILLFTLTSLLPASSSSSDRTNRAHRHDNNTIYILDRHTTCVRESCVNVTEDPFFNASIVMRTIHNAEREKPIRVIISTYGGLLSHCQKILHWLKLHPGGHIAYVNEAYSAGAMVALSAGEIVMTEHSFMGKIDPQVAGEEPVIYQRLHERSRSTNRTTIDKIDYTMLAAVATMNTMEKILNESVANYSLLGPVIKEHFIYGETRHYTVFYLAEMKAMGFNVREPTAGEEIYFGYYQN